MQPVWYVRIEILNIALIITITGMLFSAVAHGECHSIRDEYLAHKIGDWW